MRTTFFLLIAATAGITAVAAICGEPEELRTPRTIAVDELTFEDVQQRALDAIARDGAVYHLATTTTFEEDGDTYVIDTWIDIAQPVARRETRGSESVDLQYNGRQATVLAERFYDGSCEPCGATEAARFAPHLDWILYGDNKSQSVDEGVLDGQPTIIVRIKREAGGETEGDESAEIHLGEDFLPIEMRVDPAGDRSTSIATFENEFVAPPSLPADLFSPESLMALAGGPRSDIEQAIAAGLDVYWLGDAFEDMILRDGSRYYADIADGELNLEYGPADDFVPSPCVRITSLARSAWDDLRREASYGTFIPNLGDVVPDGTAMTAAGPATLYRSADAPPRAAVTPLVPLGQSAPTPPPLPDVSGDDGTARFALIEGHSTVTIVATNCGPTGSNTYRTPDAFARVLDALIAYSES